MLNFFSYSSCKKWAFRQAVMEDDWLSYCLHCTVQSTTVQDFPRVNKISIKKTEWEACHRR
jgi:hypothetical protein